MDKAAQAALDDGWAYHIEGTWNFSKYLLTLEGEIYAATQTQSQYLSTKKCDSI
jgi:glutathione peroxidase-family protein